MVNKEIAEDIIRYGQELAVFGPQSLTTGFLTYEIRNQIEKEEAMDLARQSELIVRELIKQLTVSGENLDDYKCRVLYQYIFDKVAEVTYKTLVGEDVDTVLNINEAFDYHEPDLPYYIQQKITNAVPRIASVSNHVLQYIDENEYHSDDLEEWLLPFLLLPVGQAIEFVMEMDLDDDSELRRFVGED